jgi:NAD(P)-dependent dehydrogenase (short-subunit alcohol dehydrogenase family)
MSNLNNKVIVISGSSSGIGRSCAIRCSEQGAKVALLGRDETRLKETLSKLSGEGHKFYCQDLVEYDKLKDLVSRIAEDIGVISGFIHSAGIEIVLPLKLTEPHHFERAFAVNVISGFELTKHIVKKKNVDPDGASIIYISSVMGVTGQPTKTVYSATKGALISGTRSLAVELARYSIRVNCVSPAVVKTGMSQAMMDKTTSDAVEEIIKAHPLGIGQPKDVADTCVFLLSDSAKWITGTNIVVDGGYVSL